MTYPRFPSIFLALIMWCIGAGLPLAAQSSLTLSSLAAAPGATVTLDLTLASTSGTEPAAVQWTLDYPVASVSSLTMSTGAVLTSALKTLTCAKTAGRVICVAAGPNANRILNGIVARVTVSLSQSTTPVPFIFSGAIGASVTGSAIAASATSGIISVTSSSPPSTPTLSGVTCTPAILGPGGSSACTVQLSGAALAATTVALAKNTASLSVPASVQVAINSGSATFSAVAGAFTSDVAATITAGLNTVSKTATLSLVTATLPSSLTCAVSSLTANSSSTCTVTLSRAASAGGSVVSLSDNAAALTVPASVTVPANSTSVAFGISTTAISADQSATITATLGGASKTATLSLLSGISGISVTSLACDGTVLSPQGTTSCAVNLSKPSPSPGTVIAMSVSGSGLTVPSSVTVPTNATLVKFTIRAGTYSAAATVTVKATLGASSSSRAISLVTEPTLSTIGCTQTVAAGSPGQCILTLTGPSAKSLTASLKSSNPGLSIPSSQNFSAGSTVGISQFSTVFSLSGNVTISATQGGVTKTSTVAVQAQSTNRVLISNLQVGSEDPAATTSLSCDPNALGANENAVCEIQLPGAQEPIMLEARSGEIRIRNLVSLSASGARAVDSLPPAVPFVPTLNLPSLQALENSANPSAVGACVPGSPASLTGQALFNGSAPLSDRSGAVTSLGGTRVLVNGIFAGVLYASPDRVDFLCPGFETGTLIEVAVETAVGVSGPLTGRMDSLAPGLFTVDRSGAGQALAVRAGTADLAAPPGFGLSGIPAAAGDVLTVWATGIPCAAAPSLWPVLKFGGRPVAIESMKAAAQNTGVCEIQAVAPPDVFGDAVQVTLEASGVNGQTVVSNAASVAIEPRE